MKDGVKTWVLIGILVPSICAISLLVFVRSNKPRAPLAQVISDCKPLVAGSKRLGDGPGIQFEVSTDEFTIREGTTDAAPFIHSFDLKQKTGSSKMQIDYGPAAALAAVDPAVVFSSDVQKRTIFNSSGKPVGQDTWGYLSSGERWRRVHFKGFVHVKYDFVQAKEAERFDRVINSACVASDPT